MLRRCRPWLAAALLLAPLAPALAAEPAPPSAGARLEQAREQLLQQALQASTRVEAWSWIDSQGRLQEHQSMRQAVELPALQGAGSTLPARDLVRAPAPTRQDCALPMGAAPLYPTLALRTVLPGRWPAAVRERLQETLQLRWLGEDAQRPWRMFRATADLVGLSPYERLLLSPPAERHPWRAELQLEPLPSERAERTRMAWRLVVLHQEQALLEQRAELTLALRAQPWGAPEWTEQAWQQVGELLAQWSQRLDQQFACVRPQPEVVAQEGQRWVLNMGRLAGLRLGDEWALIDPAWLPERTLEAGAIEQLVVARVVRLDAMRAELSLVAGEAGKPRTGWIAQPLHDPRAALSAALPSASARR